MNRRNPRNAPIGGLQQGVYARTTAKEGPRWSEQSLAATRAGFEERNVTRIFRIIAVEPALVSTWNASALGVNDLNGCEIVQP